MIRRQSFFLQNAVKTQAHGNMWSGERKDKRVESDEPLTPRCLPGHPWC